MEINKINNKDDYGLKIKITYNGKEIGCYSLTQDMAEEVLSGGDIYGIIGGYDSSIAAFTRGMFSKYQAETL